MTSPALACCPACWPVVPVVRIVPIVTIMRVVRRAVVAVVAIMPVLTIVGVVGCWGGALNRVLFSPSLRIRVRFSRRRFFNRAQFRPGGRNPVPICRAARALFNRARFRPGRWFPVPICRPARGGSGAFQPCAISPRSLVSGSDLPAGAGRPAVARRRFNRARFRPGGPNPVSICRLASTHPQASCIVVACRLGGVASTWLVWVDAGGDRARRGQARGPGCGVRLAALVRAVRRPWCDGRLAAAALVRRPARVAVGKKAGVGRRQCV